MKAGRWLALLVIVALVLSPTFSAYSNDSSQLSAKPQQDGGRGTPQSQPVKQITDQWAVELTAGTNPDAFAQANGYVNLGQIANLPNMYLFRVPTTDTKIQTAQATTTTLSSSASVVWFEQQVSKQQETRPVPTDPGLASQWHLINTGQNGGTAGQDANVAGAWNAGYDGTGVLIGVVDDGLDTTHPDIAPNYNANASYDYNEGNNDPNHTLPGDGHGTAAAGVAMANDDASAGSCGVGAAYNAQVAGLRLISAGTTDAQEANAMADALATTPGVVQISSNSWGPSDNGQVLEAPGPLTLAAFQAQTTSGRGGRGTIFVWAGGNGGNGDNAGADGYASSRFTISVAATTNTGVRSSYSEPGSAHIVNAPSNGGTLGIQTTDRQGAAGYTAGNCTPSFGGTSSAAPLVSGVVALMLDANPNLTWRDVQHVLINTAEQNDPANASWLTNAAGHDYSLFYGFGRVDAAAATAAAATWVNVPAVATFDSGTQTANVAIPDNNATGVTRTFTVTTANINRLEHVELVFNATHAYRGDIVVTLTSPSGTVSQLMGNRNDPGDNYVNWRFMSVHFWDENPNGLWTIRVSDVAAPDAGTFGSWRLQLYGTQQTSGDTLATFNTATNATNLMTSLQDLPPLASYTVFATGAPATGQWVMGDWNGDTQKTPGVYAANGVFYYTNVLGPTSSWQSIWIGLLGRPPVAGRFNNSVTNDCIGAVDSASFPPFGTAYALYFTCNLSGTPANPPLTVQWLSVLLPDSQGHTGAAQFAAGDFDANGVASIAIRRSGTIAFTNVPPTTLESAFNLAQFFGTPSTSDYGIFLAGDWNGDNTDSFGLYYQSGYFYRRDDVQWNSGIHILQRIGQPIGLSGIHATSWRNGGGSAGGTAQIAGDAGTSAPENIATIQRLIESDDELVAQGGTWAFQPTNAASGGGYLYSSGTLDDVLTLEFVGTSLSVVYLTGPTLGSFTIVVDDVAVRTVIATDGTAAFNQRTVVTYLEPGPHTLQIVPVGGVVAIDAFDVTVPITD